MRTATPGWAHSVHSTPNPALRYRPVKREVRLKIYFLDLILWPTYQILQA